MATGQTVRNQRVTPSGPSSSAAIERHRSREQALWDALNRARRDQTLQTLACVEDAVFRYYLPMARSIAHEPDTNDEGPGVDDAAELGLAEAVLAWRHRESDGFDRFARASITYRLRDFCRPGLRSARQPGFAGMS